MSWFLIISFWAVFCSFTGTMAAILVLQWDARRRAKRGDIRERVSGGPEDTIEGNPD